LSEGNNIKAQLSGSPCTDQVTVIEATPLMDIGISGKLVFISGSTLGIGLVSLTNLFIYLRNRTFAKIILILKRIIS
jgi:hypothetical protein